MVLRRTLLGLIVGAFALPLGAAQLGDDGLHKTDWMRDTFKDLREDLEEANSEGKRLVRLFQQRDCVYCTKMRGDVFPREGVSSHRAAKVLAMTPIFLWPK